MHCLTPDLWFPDPEYATSEGLLAIGGDLSVTRLLLAYNSGIFPWYEKGQSILWWSPDPRMILFPHKFKVSKSLRNILKSKKFHITVNRNFPDVIKYCATVKRKGQEGTWITPAMQRAYIDLHQRGHALSIEVWEHDRLVGGLYGVDIPGKRVFCGESMFSLVSNASKVAFYYLSKYAISQNYKFIDCQLYNRHLESLGAEEMSRHNFLALLSS